MTYTYFYPSNAVMGYRPGKSTPIVFLSSYNRFSKHCTYTSCILLVASVGGVISGAGSGSTIIDFGCVV